MSSRTPQIKNQMYIFPELLADKVESKPHAARFFSYLAGILNLNLYKCSSMGTPPYARTTLMAVMLYAMSKGHFESEGIVRFVDDSIGAQWILGGMKMPSYKTVQRTMDALLSELDSFFTQILRLCEQCGLIGGERAYTDGTKEKANASKHKAMSYEYLIKKLGRGKETLKALFATFQKVFDGLDDMTGAETEELVLADAQEVHRRLEKSHQEFLKERQEQIFNIDEGEITSENRPDPEKLKAGLKIMEYVDPQMQEEALDILNNIAFTGNRVVRMEEAKSELESRWEAVNGDQKIPETQQINFTDPESCIMTTKHQGVQQCYNHFAIVDNKANIILGTYTSNNASDQLGLIPTIENTEKTYGTLEGFQLGGDAGFFSADNIIYAEGKGIDLYASFPEAKSPYAKDKFKYEEITDSYTCPQGKILTVEKKSVDGKKCKYSNEAACASCKNSAECTKANDGIRRIERDMKNDMVREKAKEKAKSEEGREILRQRKSVVEPVWGNIKVQDRYTQMHFRGEEKAALEFMLHCLMQNIRKLLKVYFHSSSWQEVIHSGDGIGERYQQTG